MRRLLIDTNILILLVVGTHKPDLISRHRRTSLFTPDDLEVLSKFRQQFSGSVTTSPLLTEVSNLLGNDFHAIASAAFKQAVAPMTELAVASAIVLADRRFSRLGFADTASLLVMDDRTVLLTDDVQLYLQALHSGLNAVNFRHLTY